MKTFLKVGFLLLIFLYSCSKEEAELKEIREPSGILSPRSALDSTILQPAFLGVLLDLKSENQNENFVNNFGPTFGFPYWNESIIVQNESIGDLNFRSVVPLINENLNEIAGMLVISRVNSEYYYEIIEKDFIYSSIDTTGFTSNEAPFSQLLLLDHFSHNIFCSSDSVYLEYKSVIDSTYEVSPRNVYILILVECCPFGPFEEDCFNLHEGNPFGVPGGVYRWAHFASFPSTGLGGNFGSGLNFGINNNWFNHWSSGNNGIGSNSQGNPNDDEDFFDGIDKLVIRVLLSETTSFMNNYGIDNSEIGPEDVARILGYECYEFIYDIDGETILDVEIDEDCADEKIDEVLGLTSSCILHSPTCESSFPFVQTGNGWTCQVTNIAHGFLNNGVVVRYIIEELCLQVGPLDEQGDQHDAESAALVAKVSFDDARRRLCEEVGVTIFTSYDAEVRFKELLLEFLLDNCGQNGGHSLSTSNCFGNIPSQNYELEPFGIFPCSHWVYKN